MKGRQLPETPIDGKAMWSPVDGKAQWKPAPSPMDAMWAEAAREFEKICGKSLSRGAGDVRGFDDVQKRIETANKPSYGNEPTEDDKWKKAKDVGLQSLKWLKLLVGAAAQASSFVSSPPCAPSCSTRARCEGNCAVRNFCIAQAKELTAQDPRAWCSCQRHYHGPRLRFRYP